VRLVDPGDIVDKIVYAICNPVKDNLVDKAHHWPGASSLDAFMHGKPLVASRPRHFFRDEGAMPDVVSLSIPRPTPFKELSQNEFTAMVAERIRSVEQAVAAERSRTGIQVLGRRAILAQKWNRRPTSREPRRQLDPRIAARSKWSRIEALMRNRAFGDA
jgi:hypothetical protein